MKQSKLLFVGVAAAALLAGLGTALAADPIGKGLTMYMQMGGNAGDGATLARQTGAEQAAAALGVELKEQFSAWAPETMINQFKEAVAAKPSCIEIMGHPGATAFHDLVKAATDQGIVVTDGNSPMTSLQSEFGTKGFGYAGVDLYAGGALTAQAMLSHGLKAVGEHSLGGQRAAGVKIDAGIAEALGAELALQGGHRRIAVGDDDALVGGGLDEVMEGGRAGMAHDLDAARLGGDRFLELVDHGFRRPGRELLLQFDAQRRGGLLGAGLAGERGAVAGVAAHLHIHGQALADRVGGQRRAETSEQRRRGDADE